MRDEYKDYLDQKRCRSTRKSYLSDFDQFADFMCGKSSDITKATVADITEFTERIEESYLPSTAARKKTSLRIFLQWLEIMGRSKSIVSHVIEIHYPAPNFRHSITQENQDKLFRCLYRNNEYEVRDAAIFALVLYCGCKISDIVKIIVSDINEPRKILTIRHQQIDIQAAIPFIRDYLSLRLSSKYPPLDGASQLFVNRYGNGISDRSIRRKFHIYTTRAGFKANPRELRHTFSLNQLKSGVLVKELARKLGNKSQSSLQVYKEQLERLVGLE